MRSSGYYQSSIDKCRFILMLCVCLNIFGIPTMYGGIVQILLNFAPCAFFIFSGFLVLSDGVGEKELIHEARKAHIRRTIFRSGITFAALLIAYLGLNLIFEREQTLMMLSSKRFWFDFLALNIFNLPIGIPIWYVQALLYAYIIIYVLECFDLLRFDWIIAAVLLVVSLLTGELSGVIHFRFLDMTYIPGNFFTRALPYILIGGLLRRRPDLVMKISANAVWIAIIGLTAIGLESAVLLITGTMNYYGHLLGMGVIAVAICGWTFTDSREEYSFAKMSFRRNARLITYYFCSPIYYLLIWLTNRLGSNFLGMLMPVRSAIVILICLTITAIHEEILYLRWRIHRKLEKKKIKKAENTK